MRFSAQIRGPGRLALAGAFGDKNGLRVPGTLVGESRDLAIVRVVESVLNEASFFINRATIPTLGKRSKFGKSRRRGSRTRSAALVTAQVAKILRAREMGKAFARRSRERAARGTAGNAANRGPSTYDGRVSVRSVCRDSARLVTLSSGHSFTIRRMVIKNVLRFCRSKVEDLPRGCPSNSSVSRAVSFGSLGQSLGQASEIFGQSVLKTLSRGFAPPSDGPRLVDAFLPRSSKSPAFGPLCRNRPR